MYAIDAIPIVTSLRKSRPLTSLAQGNLRSHLTQTSVCCERLVYQTTGAGLAVPGHRHWRNLSQPIPSKSNQPNELLGIRLKPHCNEPQTAPTTQKPILAPTSPRAHRPIS